jgi:hypothetical protein
VVVWRGGVLGFVLELLIGDVREVFFIVTTVRT